MKKVQILSVILILVIVAACQSENNENVQNKENPEIELPKRQVELEFFETNVGWGYIIIINGNDYITQKHLPCECGGEGFKTKEKAILAAEFLKQKIENHERSLQINRAQLDSLGAL